MAEKKWKKSPPALIARYDAFVPEAPGVERRQMFGYPAAFVNGNLFFSLHESNMILKLGPEDHPQFLADQKAKVFDPMGGRPMREYAVVPKAVRDDDALLAEWVGRSLAYVGSLPKKEKKPRRKRA